MTELKNNDNWLFKFMPFSLNALKIFINQELWFGPPNIQNDTFEVEFVIDDEIQKIDDKCLQFRLDEELESIMKSTNCGKIKSKKEIFEKALKQSIRNFTGICSFSKTFDEDLLWSHYADSNRGIGIVFNKEQLFEHLRAFEKDDVQYLENIPRVSFVNDNTNGYLYYDEDIFIRKSKAWKYEDEYRFVNIYNSIHKDKKNSRVHLFNVSDIIGIILGEKFSENDRKTLDNLLTNNGAYKHIEYWRCYKNFKENKLDIVKIKNIAEEWSDFSRKIS